MVAFWNSGTSNDPSTVFGAASATTIALFSSGARSPVIADFNLDGNADVVVVQPSTPAVTLLINGGGAPPSFSQVNVVTGVSGGNIYSRAVVADFGTST